MLVRLAMILGLCVAFPGMARAQLETTHAFGVSVSADDIFSAADESRLFWASVRDTMGDGLPGMDPAVADNASTWLKTIDSRLTERAFSDDSLPDVCLYLGNRVRRYAIYRDLRESMQDDALLCRLACQFETQQFHLNLVDAQQRDEGVQKLMDEIARRCETAGLPQDRLDESMGHWDRLADCHQALYASETGRMLMEIQQKVGEGDPQVRAALRRVLFVGDWTMVIRGNNGDCPRGEQFLAAWHFCSQCLADEEADYNKQAFLTR